MADITLGADRSYSLVTTVVHRTPAASRCRAQIDLHVGSGDLRIRFLDQKTLARFCRALNDLLDEAYLPDPRTYRPVLTRVYSDDDPSLPAPRSFLDGLYS